MVGSSPSKAERLAFMVALIGRPYRIGATGPDAFDCYGLAQYLQHHLFSYDLPELGAVYATTRQQAEAMLKHPEARSWRQIPDDEAREGNIVLMGNTLGRDFHLGTYVMPATAGVVLHIDRTSGVLADDLPSLRAIGFNYVRIFRRD